MKNRNKSAPKQLKASAAQPQAKGKKKSISSSVSSTRRKHKTINTLWTRVVARGEDSNQDVSLYHIPTDMQDVELQ